MLRASLINGNWLNLDADLSKHIETLTDPGVIEWFFVENNNTLKPGKAWVKAVRSNGETIFVYVELKSDFSFSLTSGKLWIELSQEAIDNWLLNAEDGTGIASIKTWPTVPSQNFLLLASVTSWVAKDERNLIPKVGQIAQRTTTLEEKVSQAEEKVGKLEEAGAPGYLSIKWYSKEDIALWDMVVVDNPNVGEVSATIMLSVGDIEENQELHIQRIGSWQQLSSIKIPLQKVGNPSDGLLIQVMESKEVTISWKKHRMGTGVAIATATVRAGDIPSTMTVKDINFSAVKLELGKKYSVVIKRSGNVINNQNFYKIWCLDKRCSSSFELVFWGTPPRIKSDFTPTVYIKSSAFFSRVFGKNTPQDVVIKTYNVDAYFSWGYHAQKTYNFTAEADIKQLTWSVGYHHNRDASITITQNGKTLYNRTIPTWSGTYTETFEVDIKPWTFQVTYYAYNSSTLKRSEKLLKWNGRPYTAGQTATIWEQIEAIIYWEFLDRLIGEQIDTTISSSATTWWIPPANAVGYMSILWPDGKKYKIRVYGE